MGYAIVIDISVARAASKSGKPNPEACRRALSAISSFDHRVAMSKPVYNEWIKTEHRPNGQPRTYASLLAIQWLTDMRSSGRVNDIVIEDNSQLRQRCLQGIQNNPRSANSAAPVAKDFHLVETALHSDKRVLSLDDKMFNHLAHLFDIANEVCAVLWVNPVSNPAEEWLRNGAPDVSKYHVCKLQE